VSHTDKELDETKKIAGVDSMRGDGVVPKPDPNATKYGEYARDEMQLRLDAVVALYIISILSVLCLSFATGNSNAYSVTALASGNTGYNAFNYLGFGSIFGIFYGVVMLILVGISYIQVDFAAKTPSSDMVKPGFSLLTTYLFLFSATSSIMLWLGSVFGSFMLLLLETGQINIVLYGAWFLLLYTGALLLPYRKLSGMLSRHRYLT
jgi:hypothetical protein